MSRYIIRKIQLAHCKRGPARCEQCRELNTEKICLLDICPPHAGKIQRRVIPIDRAGETVWREYDIVRAFGSQAEALAYAAEHGNRDLVF